MVRRWGDAAALRVSARVRARVVGAALVACALVTGEGESAAVQLPTTSASAYIQTSGPNAAPRNR